MFHYFDVCQNQQGDALPGWYVEVVQVDSDTVIPIYADEGGTPIDTVSGVTNRAKTDSVGNYDFFVQDGNYSLKFYNSSGVYQRTQRYLPMYGNLSGAIADGIAAITASAANAATSATNAATSETNAAASATSASASAATATTQAGAVAAAMNSSSAPYANAYASTLPKGVTSIAIGTAGTGGTSGTYALGVSGGPAGFAGTYTISGGGVTAITITNPGLATATTAPTLSFPSGSVTGAAATATVSTLIADQKTYWVASSDSSQILLYGNNGGSVATAPFGGTQLVLYGKAAVDGFFSVTRTASTRWVPQVTPAAPLTTGTVYDPTTGAGSASAGYQAVTLALTGNELGLRATARVSGTGNALACYYDVSNAFISSEVVGTGTPTVYTNQTLNPPATARKVIVCGTNNSPTRIEVLTAVTTSTVADQAALGKQAASSLASAVDSGVTPTTGSYVSTSGIITANASFKYLEYTVTARDISYTATGTTSGTAMVLAAYIDANGQMISSEFTGGASPVAYTNQALSPPYGTVKIRLSGTASASLALTVTQIPSSAATQIAAAQTAAGRGAAAANSLDTYQASGIAATAGSYVSGSGGLVANASYQYLDYTPDGTETAFQVSGVLAGAATQLANYLNAAGTSLGTQFPGTGSNVTYTNQVLTVPTGTTKIRLCALASSTLTLSVKKPLANAGDLIQSGSGNSAIAIWGDSMAYMLAPVVAALYPSRTTYNEGIGGQTTQHVAARMGAIPVTMTSGITLPTSGTVSVTPSIDLLFSNRSTAVSCRVMVLGIECWLVCAATTGAYTLRPVNYPASALTIPAGTNIKVISGAVLGSDPSAQPLLKTILSGTVVVRASRNDTSLITSGAGRTTVLGYMQAIVTQVAAYGGNLMLMTGTNGTIDMPTSSGLPGASSADAATADLKLSSIATLNASIMATWPDVAIDPLANHVMRGGSTNQTPVSTTYAVLDSSTLQSDGLHENTGTGQPRTAAFVQSFITSRGW